jgi:hypothetical protein
MFQFVVILLFLLLLFTRHDYSFKTVPYTFVSFEYNKLSDTTLIFNLSTTTYHAQSDRFHKRDVGGIYLQPKGQKIKDQQPKDQQEFEWILSAKQVHFRREKDKILIRWPESKDIYSYSLV